MADLQSTPTIKISRTTRSIPTSCNFKLTGVTASGTKLNGTKVRLMDGCEIESIMLPNESLVINSQPVKMLAGIDQDVWRFSVLVNKLSKNAIDRSIENWISRPGVLSARLSEEHRQGEVLKAISISCSRTALQTWIAECRARTGVEHAGEKSHRKIELFLTKRQYFHLLVRRGIPKGCDFTDSFPLPGDSLNTTGTILDFDGPTAVLDRIKFAAASAECAPNCTICHDFGQNYVDSPSLTNCQHCWKLVYLVAVLDAPPEWPLFCPKCESNGEAREACLVPINLLRVMLSEAGFMRLAQQRFVDHISLPTSAFVKCTEDGCGTLLRVDTPDSEMLYCPGCLEDPNAIEAKDNLRYENLCKGCTDGTEF